LEGFKIFKIFLLTCSDGRVDPSNALNIDTKDIFYLRTPGATTSSIFKKDDYITDKAGLTFAILDLNIRKIVVLSHHDRRAHKSLHKASNGRSKELSSGELYLAQCLKQRGYENPHKELRLRQITECEGMESCELGFDQMLDNKEFSTIEKEKLCMETIKGGLLSLSRLRSMCKEIFQELSKEDLESIKRSGDKIFFELIYDDLNQKTHHIFEMPSVIVD